MKGKTKKYFKLNNRGFSLGELLVTILIMCILMSVGITGYASWQQTAEFRYNNETAKVLFSVIQNNLAERRNGGTLEDVARRLEGFGNVDGVCGTIDEDRLRSLTLSDASFEIAEENGAKRTVTYEAYPDGTTYNEIYEGFSEDTVKQLYYINADSDDWQRYTSNQLTDDNDPEKLLYDLMSEYVFDADQDLLNGSVCVEFDPVEGLVYSVFFCRDMKEGADNSLNYTSGTADYNMIDRSSFSRKARGFVGYFGVRNLGMGTFLLLDELSIRELKLENGETLKLSFALYTPDSRKEIEKDKLKYKIDVYEDKSDRNSDRHLMTISLNRPEETEDSIYRLKTETAGSDIALLVDCTVTKYYMDSTSGGLTEQVGETCEMTFPAWIGSDGKVNLILDAIDYNAACYDRLDVNTGLALSSYGNYIRAMKEAPNATYNAGGNLPLRAYFVDCLKNTFSIYRFGISDVDKIYCKVEVSGEHYKKTPVRTSNAEHRAFDKDSSGEKYEFHISNGRHLFNVRFEETASKARASGESYKYYLRDKAENDNDREIRWDEIKTAYAIDERIVKACEEENSVVDNNHTIGKRLAPFLVEYFRQSKILAEPGEDGAVPFLSLPELGRDSVMKSLEQGSNSQITISGLNIDKKENNYWLRNVKEADSSTPEEYKKLETGLFLTVDGKISDVALKDIKVKGADMTGAFCGINRGTLEKLKVSAGGAGKTDVKGHNYVGGIAGYNDIGGAVKECRVEGGHITASGTFAGGLIGVNCSKESLVSNTGRAEVVSVNNSNKVKIKARYCAGGFIGGNIVPTNSDLVVNLDKFTLNADVEADITDVGAVAGGFIGYCRLLKGGIGASSLRNMINYLASLLEEPGKDGQFVYEGFDRTRSDNVLTVTGTVKEESDLPGTQIKANYFAGGIIGYVTIGTKVTFDSVKNRFKVVADKVFEYDEIHALESVVKPNAKYSFAGGFAGFGSPTTVIRNCKTADVGDVRGKGTYTGGICEVNRGTIENCTVSKNTVNDITKLYVGGLCGVNDGRINGVIFESGAVVRGKDYVGGMASENHATIILTRSQYNSIEIECDGSNYGKIAAYNDDDAEVIIREGE